MHQEGTLESLVLTTGPGGSAAAHHHKLEAALHVWCCAGLPTAQRMVVPHVTLTELLTVGIQHAAQVCVVCVVVVVQFPPFVFQTPLSFSPLSVYAVFPAVLHLMVLCT